MVVLNLGCGRDDLGVGVDIHYDPDIRADLNQGIPAATNTVDGIRAYHVLEHLENPTQFLAECRRVLDDAGVLALKVPNVAWFPVRVWLTQDPQRFWSHKDPERRGHWLARRIGNTDERRTPHKTLWTPQLLREYLERAGFEHDLDRLRSWHGSKTISALATPRGDR